MACPPCTGDTAAGSGDSAWAGSAFRCPKPRRRGKAAGSGLGGGCQRRRKRAGSEGEAASVQAGKLSAKETISISIQMVTGIQAAHNCHIIHRDIKPQNIIISKDGKVKVTDFGIARATTSTATQAVTTTVMGSVHYTSPEQARGGIVDEKSDIYSAGITMYEMITGHVPFDGDSTVTVALKHLNEVIKSPAEEVPDIPYLSLIHISEPTRPY